MAFSTPAKRRPPADATTPNVRARLGLSPSTPARRERERDGSQARMRCSMTYEFSSCESQASLLMLYGNAAVQSQ